MELSPIEKRINLRIVDSCQCCVYNESEGLCSLHGVIINSEGWTTICDDYIEYKGE